MSIYEESLEYHSRGRKGKIEVIPTKPVASQKDLSLAYSPGVAEPVRMIAEKHDNVYEYTAKGNLVAVVSNGTAVLGLGNVGAAASKPVMEGKGILFKKLADIDVFDIELDAQDPDDVIRACEMLEPTFGGINLEDIKAPDCFYIEEELRKRLKIPVFHDDQHGTAVISAAAFLNALEIIGKKIEDCRIVISGGGAAAIACANLYVDCGAKRENIIMTDSKGVIYKGRGKGMNPYKERYATESNARTIGEALEGADAFFGVSVKGAVTKDMVAKMAKDPIVFAMANPDPEILPEDVLEVRDDAIVATGRSDYPNQVNNVLGFPFIFRGALDTFATTINSEMKRAAVQALADLAREDVPDSVSRQYGGQQFRFGRDYLIPKPTDRRVLLWLAPAVAKAAMDSGVARRQLDLKNYRDHCETLLGSSYTVMRGIKNQVIKAGADSRVRLAFPEGDHPKILRAAAEIAEEQIATPILLGDEARIKASIKELGLDRQLQGVDIVRPSRSSKWEQYAQSFFEMRHRKGITLGLARTLMKQPNYYGAMMLEMGDADGFLGGVSTSYPDTLSPLLQIIGTQKGSRLAGVYMVITKKKTYWFADTTVNISPDAEGLADIAIQTSELFKSFNGVEPRVAMLSFSNFGSNRHPDALKVMEATQIVRDRRPDLIIDGEMQADTAVFEAISQENFPFNRVPGDANILIFPDLNSGNIAYKLVSRIADADTIGPILVGMQKPVHVLQRASDVNDIVNMAAITAMEVQLAGKAKVSTNTQ
jgi:malate dehydrogenase (oxaloacetate-decarboxylating)(NADP+)